MIEVQGWQSTIAAPERFGEFRDWVVEMSSEFEVAGEEVDILGGAHYA